MSVMGLKIYAGRTFHLPTPPAMKPHLWVAMTEPDGTPEETVIVNLTTRHPNSDTTVILDSGDHRFIKHETVVNYADALFTKIVSVQNAIKNGLSSFDDDCSSALLERIQIGLLQSPFTPKKIKSHCKKCFGGF
ncbi:hypothetical protein [Nostoc sp.]|uniref:hypothetical protein n=1 Tax=Nostoc sp. TaxID=1180 RepID=UPI002FFC7253